MAKNEIDILLSIDDKATKTLDKMEKKSVSMKNTFKLSAVEINASFELMQKAFGAAGKALDFIEKGAKFEQQKVAFERLAQSAGKSSKAITKAMQEMSGGTISAADAMAGATKAMVLGLDADKLPKLMEIARVSARAFGTDVGFMFDSLSLGIGRQSRMLLDNLGIIVDAEGAYNKYAESMGLVASKLTDAEKKQAFLNAALEAGQDQIDKMGGGVKTQAEEIATLKATWDDFVTSLAVFISKSGFVVKAFTALGVSAKFYLEQLERIKGISDSGGLLGDLESNLKKVNLAIDANLKKQSAPFLLNRNQTEEQFNDLLIQRSRILLAINDVKKTDTAEQEFEIDGTKQIEQQVLIEEEKQRLLAEALAAKMQSLLDFQNNIAFLDDATIAAEITRLEQSVLMNKGAEEQKTAIYQAEDAKRKKIQADADKRALAQAELEKKINNDLIASTGAFFGAMAEENKGFALLQKAISIFQIIIKGQAAVANMQSQMGVLAPPFVAKQRISTALQIGTVAASAFADGGIVKARPGGILAQIGEAGQDEAVIPLDRAGGFGDVNIFIQGGINPGGSSVDEMAEELGFAFEREVRSARGF